MKKFYLFITLNFSIISIYGQYIWAKAEGLWEYDYGYGITTDNTGNVYVAGKYEMNGAIFSGTPISCAGNHDIFVAKYDPAGTMQWIRTAGGYTGDYAEALSCDGSYLYVSGEIEGYGNTISFPGSTITLQCVGDNDAFLCKYDLNGNLLWARSEGALLSEKAIGNTYDSDGNIYICGYFSDNTKFNGVTHTGAGGRDIYLAKYDQNGVFQWIQYAGSSGRDEAKSIKCDASGNVYICGMYSNGANFSGQVVNSPNGYYNAFLAKYNSSGTLQWIQTGGGDYDEVAWSLALDNTNRIYVTGEFNASANFGTHQIITSGNADVFIAAYDTDGAIVWIKKAGGPLIDRARGIGCNGINVYLTGQFGATANFGTSMVSAADSSDIFIAGINSAGDFLWSASVGGVPDALETLGYESGNAICADINGNVYSTGGLLNGGSFGATNLIGYTRTDVFITRISTAEIGFSENNSSGNISIYPNPVRGNVTINVDQPTGKSAEISIYNCLGLLIDKKVVQNISSLNKDMSAMVPGIYIVELLLEDKTLIRKKLILRD